MMSYLHLQISLKSNFDMDSNNSHIHRSFCICIGATLVCWFNVNELQCLCGWLEDSFNTIPHMSDLLSYNYCIFLSISASQRTEKVACNALQSVLIDTNEQNRPWCWCLTSVAGVKTCCNLSLLSNCFLGLMKFPSQTVPHLQKCPCMRKKKKQWRQKFPPSPWE